MEGRPVWLASVSRRDSAGKIKPTGTWTKADRAAGLNWLRALLGGVGDPRHERCFRMNITLCFHRALTTAEEARIGPGCAVHLAGGPIEVLWQKGCSDSPTTLPCRAPVRHQIDAGDDRLWVPLDCGECEPCRARALVQATGLPYRRAVAAARPAGAGG
jgi:hypothetical protein